MSRTPLSAAKSASSLVPLRKFAITPLVNLIARETDLALTSLFAAAFCYFYVPELKGRSLEEINTFFESGLPARKSALAFSRAEQRNKSERAEDEKASLSTIEGNKV